MGGEKGEIIEDSFEKIQEKNKDTRIFPTYCDLTSD
jgi:hypothetical protein